MLTTGFNYRVLVVDDDPSILQTSVLLEHKGYEVRAAKDGFAALAELRRSLPDVIISDWRCPT